MALRLHPVSASRWARLAASRHPADFTAPPDIDLGERARSANADRGPRIRAELARIQAYVDALEPQRAAAPR